MKHAADIKVGIAGRKGAVAAFALEAEIPALQCKGALEALGAQLDFEKDTVLVATWSLRTFTSECHGALFCERGRVWPRAARGGVVL